MEFSKYLYLLLGFIILGCSNSHNHEHTSPWKVKSTNNLFEAQGLENVESVLYDPKKQALYITNGLDYIPGTDGFISKASTDGKELDLKWVSDLNRPTGMALDGNNLYVADLNVLLRINTETGAIVERIEESVLGSALNDVTIDRYGNVYVSGSRLGAVFKLVDGELELWVQDKLQLKYANGLMAEKDQLWVAGFNLSTITINPKNLSDRHTHPSIKDLESIVSDGNDGYFITTVGQSSLYHLSSDMEVNSLLDDRDYFGDITYDQKTKTIYIPRGNEDSEAYYITAVELSE